MATGKPFIASDVPGLTDVVKDAGVLFQQGNAEELAQKIKELLSNDEYYKTIAERCQNRAENYNIDKMIDSHINLYKKIYEHK